MTARRKPRKAPPGEIVVQLHCANPGVSSLTVGHRIVTTGQAGHVYADGEVVPVRVEPASGRAVALPDAIRRACAAR